MIIVHLDLWESVTVPNDRGTIKIMKIGGSAL